VSGVWHRAGHRSDQPAPGLARAPNVAARFALITAANDILYPYQKSEKRRGLYGFALSARGDSDAEELGEYTVSIETVIDRVVFKGYKVRASNEKKGDLRRDGSYKIGGNAIARYWVDPSLAHLIRGAPVAPSPTLPQLAANSGRS